MWRRFAATWRPVPCCRCCCSALLGARELGERDRAARRRSRHPRRVFASMIAARCRLGGCRGALARRAGRPGPGLRDAAVRGPSLWHLYAVLIGDSVAGLPGPLQPVAAAGPAAPARARWSRSRRAAARATSTWSADLRIGARDVQAYFELSPDWLWQDAGSNARPRDRRRWPRHRAVPSREFSRAWHERAARAGAVGWPGRRGRSRPGSRSSRAAGGAAASGTGRSPGRPVAANGVVRCSRGCGLPASIQPESPWRIAAAAPVAGNCVATQPMHGAVPVRAAARGRVAFLASVALVNRYRWAVRRAARRGAAHRATALRAGAARRRARRPRRNRRGHQRRRSSPRGRRRGTRDPRRHRPPAARRHRARAGARRDPLARHQGDALRQRRHRAARRRFADPRPRLQRRGAAPTRCRSAASSSIRT